MASDVARPFRREEGDGVGDVDNAANASQRNVGEDRRVLLLVEDGGHGAFDIAGGDDVGGDSAGGELAGERFGKADESCLAGGVVCLAGLAYAPNDARDADDSAVASL